MKELKEKCEGQKKELAELKSRLEEVSASLVSILYFCGSWVTIVTVFPVTASRISEKEREAVGNREIGA